MWWPFKNSPPKKQQKKETKPCPLVTQLGYLLHCLITSREYFLFISHVPFFFHKLHPYDPTHILKDPMTSTLKIKLLQIAPSQSPSEVGTASPLFAVLKPCRMNDKLKTCHQQ